MISSVLIHGMPSPPSIDLNSIQHTHRGVGRTIPKILAFTSESEEKAFLLQHEADPALNVTTDSFARAYARVSLLASLVREHSGDTASYVGTAFVARDMLSIVRAHGREKLQYWGLSYGSTLGVTFAAMFPDKIERLVVDGVLDPYNYYEGK
jgi:pimeloyl-ACP methyl ester carboxylesterase